MFRLWNQIILQTERSKLKFPGPGTAFQRVPAYFNPCWQLFLYLQFLLHYALCTVSNFFHCRQSYAYGQLPSDLPIPYSLSVMYIMLPLLVCRYRKFCCHMLQKYARKEHLTKNATKIDRTVRGWTAKCGRQYLKRCLAWDGNCLWRNCLQKHRHRSHLGCLHLSVHRTMMTWRDSFQLIPLLASDL